MLNEQKLLSKITEAKEYIKKNIEVQPELGIILGSGLGDFADQVENKVVIPYRQIPHFPLSTVIGHAGELVIGSISGQQVLLLKGRFHYYEGYTMQEVTFPVRVMESMGLKGLIVTNAAGGINTDYLPGDLVIIQDHINLMGANPLVGKNLSEVGPRFPDMSEGYDADWREIATQIMNDMGKKSHTGVYAAVSGPSYETPAEIRYLRAVGADLVGMSTVPEVIIAKHGGLKVLGISCVTNMAAGVTKEKLSHEDVMETSKKVQIFFVEYLKKIVKALN